MTLPANWSTVTVTGTYLNIDGEPLKGTVAFSTTTRVVDAGANVTVPPGVRRVSLDKDGKFSVVLPATDDPDVAPAFYYRVDEDMVLPTGARSLTNYLIQLPAATPTVDLADVAPATELAEVSPYLRRVDLDEPGGAASSDRLDAVEVTANAAASLLGEVVADVSAVNSAAETPLAQFTLPTTLPPGSVLHFRAGGDYLNNTGATATTTCAVKLGSSVLLATAAGISTNAQRRRWTLDVLIHVTATGQVADGRLDFTQGAADTVTWALNSLAYQGRGTTAEDLSTAKVVAFAAQHTTASAALEMRVREASLVLLPKA